MKIVFVGKTPFPVSTASSNRILSLGKGMVVSGAQVYVYCFGVTKFSTNKNPIKKNGFINNVEWVYTSLRVTATNKKLINGLFLLIGQFLGYIKLAYRFYNKKPILFTSQTGFAYIFPLWIIAKVSKGKLVFFRSEFPKYVINDNKRKKEIVEKIVYPFSMKMFDGMFIMTNVLLKYFSKWKRKNSIAMLTPLTIDINKFDVDLYSPFDFPYIAYAGSLSNTKDGIEILIKAYGKIQDKYPEIRLLILGGSSSKERIKELNQFVKANVKEYEKVIFTGMISKDDIPRYLKNAKILALARPRSKQAEGGFPSKLGEYLATGNPVITTDTGEISKYLIHKVNAYVVEPNNVFDLSNGLEWILENESKAKIMGKQGKKVAMENFDYIHVTKKMISNLQTI